MTISDLESEIENYVIQSADTPVVKSIVQGDKLHVIKYMKAEHLAETLRTDQLYASERTGFTWGDAIYLAPLAFPLTTMMYGDVGVVGTYYANGARFFDASNPYGISLYQQWIIHQESAYHDLTVTVHADAANRELPLLSG